MTAQWTTTVTTQSRIAFNIREERRVLDRLRAALPPPVTLDALDFPETGGSTLMGDGWEAYYNEPPVRLASTTEAGNDNDSTAVGGTTQGTVEGPLTLDGRGGGRREESTAIPTSPRMCINHERCGRAHASHLPWHHCVLLRRVRSHERSEHAEHCCADQSLGGMRLAALKRSWCSTTPHRRKCVFDAGQDTLNLVGAQEWTLARSGARVGGLGGGGVGVLPATVLHPCQDIHHCHRTFITTGLWRWCGEARNH